MPGHRCGAPEEGVHAPIWRAFGRTPTLISGERKSEAEEKKESFYRCERSDGSFYRAIPLPDGARVEDVKATFSAGVLEVSVPLPEKVAPKPQAIPIKEPAKAENKPAA